jgi:hypothetical protein
MIGKNRSILSFEVKFTNITYSTQLRNSTSLLVVIPNILMYLYKISQGLKTVKSCSLYSKVACTRRVRLA